MEKGRSKIQDGVIRYQMLISYRYLFISSHRTFLKGTFIFILLSLSISLRKRKMEKSLQVRCIYHKNFYVTYEK